MTETVRPSGVLRSMQRFYFHLHNDVDVPDLEGRELPSLDAAKEWAAKQARELIAELIKDHGRFVMSHRIDIEDSEGRVLGTVRFRDVVQLED